MGCGCWRPAETAMQVLGRGFCGTVPVVTDRGLERGRVPRGGSRWTVGEWRVRRWSPAIGWIACIIPVTCAVTQWRASVCAACRPPLAV